MSLCFKLYHPKQVNNFEVCCMGKFYELVIRKGEAKVLAVGRKAGLRNSIQDDLTTCYLWIVGEAHHLAQ